jgi:ABC-2 type transport system ATP-binding protein
VSKISATQISLDYPIVGLGSRSLKNHILGAATGGLISGSDGIPVVKALRDINFSMLPGDRVGLIGHNGAGKSTLLKVLAGIYQPTGGVLNVEGTVVSTLNLSLGMEPEATGIENIITRGLLLGMNKRDILQKLPSIAEFTELGDYLDMPVRIYSAGMTTRLAFATVTAMDADILLMDEVIGTGDAAFLHKAELRLNDFMNRTQILVLASHSESMIKQFCNKALLLEHGRLVGFGAVDSMFEDYHNSTSMRTNP